MWETEEFGSEHEGRPGVLLADGTEPGPVYFDIGSGANVHKSTDWWVYDGTLRAPVAAEMRGACSCGWRGTARYPLDWQKIDRRRPYLFDTGDPENDWDTHIAEVRARTVPVPPDLTALIDQLRERLTGLVDQEPLAAVRAAATLERLTEQATTEAAFNIDAPGGPSWDEVGRALGISARTARTRLTRYALRY
ncbi:MULTISPECIES: hypothetical protein [unclassified Streptomyces]|uniref:hypothetical protein n=1 Tax=unclassified Streptomyces TaxID=2593676 RepID=UPI0035E2C82F